MSIPTDAAGACRAVKISEHVYWVGAIDWDIRDFHGYATQRGTTYNAYLVLGEKITLIDTVKAPFMEELLARISSVIDPATIDYIISNHSEMDHSGCLPQLIERVQPEKVFASSNGVKALAAHFHHPFEISAVKDGETIDLGDRRVTFVETRMLHWPDSMFTYLHDDGVLFTNDAFGMHLAGSARFDDDVDPSILEYEAKKYYANILLPYSALITKLLARVPTLGLEIKALATDHGPVWRTDIPGILARYGTWAAQQRDPRRAVIVYDTMWGSTAKMARAIAEGLGDNDIDVQMLPLGANHRSDVATELLDAGALLVGSPTLNNNMFPTVADVLTYLKGLRPQHLVGAAFGSYGWGGEAINQVQEILAAMGVTLIGEPLKCKYVPDTAMRAQCYALGADIARHLHDRNKEENA